MCLTDCLGSSFECTLNCICSCQNSQNNKRVTALISALVLAILAITAVVIFSLICAGTIHVPETLWGISKYIMTPILLAIALVTASLSAGCFKARNRFLSA
ncbi:hypothetical protein [Chlamydia psittaci]|uniref:hypothetical protein n=1 Tax=Chlamydia psittaci TaxID=83554 RepID=UPI00027E578D|nr:hypothetical protein [Chlamydia psittaci]AFS28231.1 hypothetical protein B712_0722 [Chlamydia psittaci NJ1]KPZ36074.1 hypothetical protein GWE_01965 [Chlamydia psittaci NJ1]MDS0919259.1 hypothetical protein [Chlamydia psittaci]MDS0989290.1 hypothetical protein [Chlamydia psittaci]MDS0995265.1 hypothetical protein [Chlamydia psittaci]